MVDKWDGIWVEEKDYDGISEDEMCDYDRMAVWIRKIGYEPKTNMGNLIDMIFLYYMIEDDEDFNIKKCQRFAAENGLRKFDIYNIE